MVDAKFNRRPAADPLQVQFFVTLGLGAVIGLAMLGSAISSAVTCPPEALPTSLATEWSPHP